MDRNKKLTNYVSPTDQVLNEFERNRLELSLTQRLEKEKHQRLFALRDTPTPLKKPKNSIWDDF